MDVTGDKIAYDQMGKMFSKQTLEETLAEMFPTKYYNLNVLIKNPRYSALG